MAKIIQLPVYDDTDTYEIAEKTKEEKDFEILEKVYPHICNDVSILIARPFRFHWNPFQETAGTDCKAEIYVNPWFFVQGFIEVGFGMVYHECGHIRYSPYGVELLDAAYRAGGETRRHIMNLILDRKDDILTAGDAPGFAETLRRRLAYISTMAYREMMKARLQKSGNLPSENEVTKLLRNIRPKDVYEDFFFSAKWRKSPRYEKTHKTMKYLTRQELLDAPPSKLLWLAEKIHTILGEMPKDERTRSELAFGALCVLVQGIELGAGLKTPSKSFQARLEQLIQGHMSRARQSGIQQLLSHLQTKSMMHPGPISTGRAKKVQVKVVAPDAKYAKQNEELRRSVEPFVEPLIKKLRRIDNPSEYVLFGRDEGELDLTQTARIAAGLPGIYKETVTERDIDAEIHLAIDASGSMIGSKIESAKKISVLFSQAIQALDPLCWGRIWAFSSVAIYDFGKPHIHSGLVTMHGEAGNSDCDMLRTVGTELAKSKKRRKVLIVICDDGPDDIEEARKISHQLLARGIIPVHILVEVHGTPKIYPVELIYNTMEECLNEFGSLLEKIISHLK